MEEMTKGKAFCLLVITLIITASGFQIAWAQVPPVDAVRGIVQKYLTAQLGREATLLEFTYEGTTWQDASLGCPQEGESYEEQEIAGYRWYFLMDDGIRYSLNSDLYGKQIVLCAATSEIDFTYSTYSNTLFSINHPNLWSAQQLGAAEFSFTFRGQSACSLPEMRIFISTTALDAPSLIDDFLHSGGINVNREDYEVFRTRGQTVRYTADCGSLPRTSQVTALPSLSNAIFLIVQSAPASVFDIWWPLFQAMLDSFRAGESSLSITGADLSSAVTPIPPNGTPAATLAPVPAITAPTAQSTAPVPMPPPAPPVDLTTVPLVNVFVGDVYIGRLNDLPGIGVTFDQQNNRTHLRTSQDGLQLAFIEANTRLYTVSLIDPLAPNLLNEDVAVGFPPSWSAEQPALAYLKETGETDPDSGEIWLEIELIYPDASRESAGRIPHESDCPAAVESGYAVDQLYAQESGINGNSPVFEWLAGDRFLYSRACDGGRLTLFDRASGELTEIMPALRRAHLSPDKTRIAGINENGLVVVDLNTLAATEFTVALPPDQVGWDATGTQLFYSSLTKQESLIWNEAASQAQAEHILGVFPFESRLNTITIMQFDTQHKIEIQRWQGVGFAVGRLQGAPDGSGILFSLIPSDRGLLINFANNASPEVISNSTPETELYWLPIVTDPAVENPTAQLLAITAQPLFAPPPAN